MITITSMKQAVELLCEEMEKSYKIAQERDEAIKKLSIKNDALEMYLDIENRLIEALGGDPDSCSLGERDIAEICERVRVSRIPKDIDTIFRNLQFMHAEEDAQKFKAERDEARAVARKLARAFSLSDVRFSPEWVKRLYSKIDKVVGV